MPDPNLPNPGALYILATPIGNLEDLSDRTKRILAEVDLVAAEDTRRTQTLLSHLAIHKPIESYHEHNERDKAEKLLRRLREGASIALVTDAGVPTISDPGAHLVARALAEGIPVSPIPGPSAILSALSVSGFNADRFIFAGYPPRKPGERRAFYAALADSDVPAVIYEAPHRLKESLDDAIAELGGGRVALIAREMTKRFEEIRRDALEDLRRHYDTAEPLGEFTIVLAPEASDGKPSAASNADLTRAAQLLLAAGVHTGDAADILAAAAGVSRNEAYATVLKARP